MGQNAPSGIAQLRSSEQAVKVNDDQMNLDDFIVPSSIGTPAGVSPTSSTSIDGNQATTATISAIPIKQQQRLQADDLSLARASAPSVPPLEQTRGHHEFSYVQRRVRKTSIDERRVRSFLVHRTCRDILSTNCCTAAKETCRGISTGSTGQQHNNGRSRSGRRRWITQLLA